MAISIEQTGPGSGARWTILTAEPGPRVLERLHSLRGLEREKTTLSLSDRYTILTNPRSDTSSLRQISIRSAFSDRSIAIPSLACCLVLSHFL